MRALPLSRTPAPVDLAVAATAEADPRLPDDALLDIVARSLCRRHGGHVASLCRFLLAKAHLRASPPLFEPSQRGSRRRDKSARNNIDKQSANQINNANNNNARNENNNNSNTVRAPVRPPTWQFKQTPMTILLALKD